MLAVRIHTKSPFGPDEGWTKGRERPAAAASMFQGSLATAETDGFLCICSAASHFQREKAFKMFHFFQGAFKETQLNVENIPIRKPVPLLCSEMNRDIPEWLLEHEAPGANGVDQSINVSAVAHLSHSPAASVCAQESKIYCLMPNGKKQGLKQLHRWSNDGYCHHHRICQHVQQLQTKGINHISSPPGNVRTQHQQPEPSLRLMGIGITLIQAPNGLEVAASLGESIHREVIWDGWMRLKPQSWGGFWKTCHACSVVRTRSNLK